MEDVELHQHVHLDCFYPFEKVLKIKRCVKRTQPCRLFSAIL